MAKYYSLLLAALLVLPMLSRAADPNPAEARLREQLRNTLLQLRTLQGERETLDAEKVALEADKQALTTKLDTVAKQAATDQELSDKRITSLEARSTAQEAEIARLTDSLTKWKAAQQEAATLAQTKEAARAKLAQEKIELQRQVADQRTRNLAMYKTGTEILARYEGFGLGTALTAREPFVGTTRVKLENLVQDYADKLAEQRIAPEPPPAPEPAGGSARKPAKTAGQTNSPTASPRNIGTKPISESGKPARTDR